MFKKVNAKVRPYSPFIILVTTHGKDLKASKLAMECLRHLIQDVNKMKRIPGISSSEHHFGYRKTGIPCPRLP